jgi:hypothetical protein
MKVQVNFKEVTYGWWEIEVPDNATDEEIYDIAWDKYGESDVNYGKTNMDITDIERV